MRWNLWVSYYDPVMERSDTKFDVAVEAPTKKAAILKAVKEILPDDSYMVRVDVQRERDDT